MPANVNDNIQELSPAQRKKVEVRAAQLIAEEMTLRQLRQARMLTQVRMAQALGLTQDSVSRLERRSDLLPWAGTGAVLCFGLRMISIRRGWRLPVAQEPDRT